jgi:nicotinate phosphoribosyltransferase
MLDSTRRKKIPVKSPHEELLVPVFRQGKNLYKIPSIAQSRQRTLTQLSLFHPAIRRFLNPHSYPVGLEKNLYEFRTALILKARQSAA